MTKSTTPPLSHGSSSGSDDSPHEATPVSQLPDYDVATGSSRANDVDRIATILSNASLKICDGPGLTQAEHKELSKALNDGVRIGLFNAQELMCSLDELKHHLRLLDLFDRLRKAVQDGTEYFDYPSCHQDSGHIDEAGIDAPPPPYAPAADPPPATDSKSTHKPTQQEAEQAAADLSRQLLRERRWNIFLNRAAYRLELWFTYVLSSREVGTYMADQIQDKWEFEDDKEIKGGLELPDYAIPPVDVALMLHAYHLNPLAKKEDSQRLRTRSHLEMFNYPLQQLAQHIHDDLPILKDVEPAQRFWDDKITSKRSKQPWDLSLQPPPGHPTHAQETNGGTIFGLRINCPRCKAPQYVPWTGVGKDPREVGIGESGWERICFDRENCSQLISADHLQMARFLDDFYQWRKSPSRPGYGKPVFFMGGTMLVVAHAQRSSRDYMGDGLFLPIFKHDKPVEASAQKERRASKPENLRVMEEVALECDYNLSTFRTWFEERWMSNAIQPRLRLADEKAHQMSRIALLMKPYQNGNAAAYGEGLCDVVDAVKRQTSFNIEMEKLGWTKHPHLLQQGVLDDVLSRALIRYHKYLDLLSSSWTLLVPTLDIDLAFHTHMLKEDYYARCFLLVGRFVNHDDAIETGILSEAFDRTAMLWRQRYQQPYSMCGCVYNNPGAIKKLKSMFGGSEPAEAEKSSGGFTTRMKGKWRAAKDLPGDKQDDATVWQEATHPSGHQAVIVKEAEHRHDRLREDMVKEWAQGKRREGHESAFV